MGDFMKFKEIISYVVIIVVVILIRTFVVTPIRVNGDSMNDTLKDGYLMILKKYEKRSIERFDIAVIDIEGDKLIKRVIGLPKEDVSYQDGQLYINNELVNNSFGNGTTKDFNDYCAEDEYFVLGDNRENSKDSRIFGCVNAKQILGTTKFVFFPFDKIGRVS